MTNAIAAEIDALQRMTTNELLERYAELHGQPSRTRHRTYLIRKAADLLARLTGFITNLVSRNQALVQLALKATVAFGFLGVALVAAGLAITLTGAAIGGLATAVGVMLKLLALSATALGALLILIALIIAGVIGLGAAVEFLETLGLDAIAVHERDVLTYAMDNLRNVPGLKIIGEARAQAGPIAFTNDGLHPYDVSPILDHQGVAIRDGHHCAQPLMDRFGVAAPMRASIGMYATRQDFDTLITALGKAREMLA